MEDQIIGAVDGIDVFEVVEEGEGAFAQLVEGHTVLATLVVFSVGMVAGVGVLKGFRLAKKKWIEYQATRVAVEV